VANVKRTPHCIFTPRTTAAAAFALKALKAHKTIFAIRSGGHSLNAGFSSTSRGVVIDLKLLNTISVDRAAGTAKIGPGNRWVTVYRALEQYDATIAGGRAAPIGIGGFTLGGGLSFYLYEYGFGADTVIEYEVVTADGEILTVNKSSHPDLFVALKGSGAPFCLVTAFTYKLIPVAKDGVYGGAVVSGNSTIPAILDEVADFMKPGAGTSDFKSHLITSLIMALTNGSDTGGVKKLVKFISNACFYQDPVTTTPKVYEGVLAAAEKELWQSTLRAPRSIANITEEFGPPDEGTSQTRAVGVPWTVINPTKKVLREMEKMWSDTWADVIEKGEIDGLATTLFYIPMGQQGRGDNVLGLKKGTEYLQMFMAASWTKESDDKRARSLLTGLYEKIVEYVKREGQYSPWMYVPHNFRTSK
jgi:FAD/FMN-containing dehydrogenase